MNKRIGRGLGSGKGKTGGRGQKGQLARGKMPLQFTGGGLPFYKKLPLRRGLGNRPVSVKRKILSLSDLNSFKSGETVSLETLLQKKIISEKEIKFGVKILGKLDIKLAKLKVSVQVSSAVKEKIEQAGGAVDA